MVLRNWLDAIRALYESEVQFIVVGGMAAVLTGVPVNTFDLDVVFSREADNVDRIMPALEKLDAIFRQQRDRRLHPNRSHVAAGGHLLLVTRFGSMDLRGTIGNNLGYEELLPHTVQMDLGEGLHVRVLDLETNVSIKEQLGRDKDLAALHEMRATLKEQRRRKSEKITE